MEKNLKNLLSSHGFSFKKNYGQNFLTDKALLNEIVDLAGVSKEDNVLEIGVGAGALTKVLSLKAKQVIGYEIDEKLKPVLKEVLSENKNVDIIFKDVLKEDLKEIESRFKDGYYLVANLPYYITTPIILKFLEGSTKVKKLVVMVQEEVSERLSACPGSKLYGALTVAINLRGKARTIKRVPREMFTPSPNVDSAVVSIDIDREKFDGLDLESVRNVVRAGFSSRRKMLVNNVINLFKLDREKAEKLLKSADIDLNCRAEQLSAENFVKLAEKYKEITNE